MSLPDNLDDAVFGSSSYRIKVVVDVDVFFVAVVDVVAVADVVTVVFVVVVAAHSNHILFEEEKIISLKNALKVKWFNKVEWRGRDIRGEIIMRSKEGRGVETFPEKESLCTG